MNMTKADYDELVRLAGIHKEWIFGLDGNRTVASGVFGYVPVKKGTFEFVTPDTIPINIAAAIAEMESKTECPYCNSKAFERVGVSNEPWDKPRVYLCGGNSYPPEHEKFDYCPKCARRINNKSAEEST